ncbi:MAG TPA: hypothetical protein VGE34_03445 [Candidatus Saccharimonadales bacterium]
MSKRKINIPAKLLVLLSITWFLAVSYITTKTGYHHLIADRLADPQGTSTPLENILDSTIVILTFIPSGLLLAYPYVKKYFTDYIPLRIFVLSIVLGFVLYTPFSWYDLFVNFADQLGT